MNGSEMVDLVIEHVGSELTRPKAISALNRAQNYYLARTRIGLMRVKPDPFLVTTAGTFSYAASTALFSSVGGVLGATQWDIRDVGLVYALDGLAGQFAYGGHDHVSQFPLEVDIPEGTPGIVKAPADWAPSLEPLSADCSIIFWEGNDPGTTTVEWRAQAYRWPTQFTAETVAFEMPEVYQETLLLLKTLESLGVKQYGAPSQNIRALLQEEEPKFYGFAGRAGGRVLPARTPPRW